MSDLDIAERRLPQDGRIRIEERNIEFRVSVIPTIFGEKVVMRILDKGALQLDLTSSDSRRSSYPYTGTRYRPMAWS
jgi:type IV pilus assembly protein PilB